SGGEERVRSCLPELESSKLVPELLEAQGRLLAAAPAHGEALFGFPVAVDDHVRDLLELRVADPLADRLVALVDLDAVALQPLAHAPRRLLVRLAHGDHAHLYRREPERERPCVVLDQNADEALERAVQRAMDDVERVLLV